MRFYLTHEANALGIAYPVIALYENVSQKKEVSSLYDPAINDVMSRITDIKTNILPTKEVQGFRELIKGLGYSKVEPAGERLLNGCIRKKAFPRYGNLVDAYNIAGLEYVAGLGVHDAEKLADVELIFKRAHGTEKMIPSFEENEKIVAKGDFTYGFNKDGAFVPLAWLGKKDVDNRDFQLKPETKSFILTAIGNMHTSQEHNIKICERTFELLKIGCPDVVMKILIPENIKDEQEIKEREVLTASKTEEKLP